MSTEKAKGNKPVHEIPDGGLKLAIWEHKGEYGPKYSATLRHRFKDKKTDEWRDATGFNEDDWLPLRELLREARDWTKSQRRAAAKAPRIARRSPPEHGRAGRAQPAA